MEEISNDNNKNEVVELFVPQNPAVLVETQKSEKEFTDILKMFSPGTSLRTALDDILRAKMGALIVLENENLHSIFEKGFKINSKFSPQRLVELAKMDGAIILSKDAKRILYANAFLFPSTEILTRETGTRHKAAERSAKQAKTLAIAVSQRKNKISIFYCDIHYELESSSEILRRASETLQILEKQRDIFNDLLNNLNLLELKRNVTVKDVCLVLQRLEIIGRVSDVVKRDLIELGREGVIVNMRMKELIGNLDKERELILKDYLNQNYSLAEQMLAKMDFDFLLEPINISRMLFEELHDRAISPKGIRLLSKTNLLDRYVDALIGNFKTLNKILLASDDELLKVLDNEGVVSFFKEELYSLKEKARIGRQL